MRHVAFWLIFAFHFFVQNLIVGSVNEARKPRSALESLQNIIYFLPVYILSTYIFINLIISYSLVNRRYLSFIIATSCLVTFNFFACYGAGVLYQHIEWGIPYDKITFSSNKYHAVVNGLFLSIMILGITGGIKLSKRWYQKQRENEELAQQKIVSELQLLKIQINPRFLFHSLHTVKKHILANSNHSPELILKIADILSYILYESDSDYIKLEKELGVINDYLALEEKGSENLNVDMCVTGDTSFKYFPPLILLSVVQSSVEYFLEQQWSKISINLKVEVKPSQFQFQIDFSTTEKHQIDLSGLKEKLVSISRQMPGLVGEAANFTARAEPRNLSILLSELPLYAGKGEPQEVALATTLL